MHKQATLLVTGVGGDIGQSILKCLKDVKPPLRLLGSDMDQFAAGQILVHKFFVSPPAIDKKKYINFLLGIIKREKIKYIIPSSEPEILLLNCARSHFEKSNVFLFINKPHIIDTFFDKYATAEFLKRNKLPYPRTYRIEDYSGELDFPLIFKPRFGYGSKGLTIVHDKEELDFLKKRRKDVVIQEIIGDIEEEYTICVFSDGRDMHSIAFKRSLGYGSLSKITKLSNDVLLLDLAKKIAHAIDLQGSINIQARRTAKGYIPFEINPRFSSTVYIRHYFGFRDVEWWINLHEGRQVRYTPKYKSGVGVRKLGEVFFDCQP